MLFKKMRLLSFLTFIFIIELTFSQYTGSGGTVRSWDSDENQLILSDRSCWTVLSSISQSEEQEEDSLFTCLVGDKIKVYNQKESHRKVSSDFKLDNIHVIQAMSSSKMEYIACFNGYKKSTSNADDQAFGSVNNKDLNSSECSEAMYLQQQNGTIGLVTQERVLNELCNVIYLSSGDKFKILGRVDSSDGLTCGENIFYKENFSVKITPRYEYSSKQYILSSQAFVKSKGGDYLIGDEVYAQYLGKDVYQYAILKGQSNCVLVTLNEKKNKVEDKDHLSDSEDFPVLAEVDQSPKPLPSEKSGERKRSLAGSGGLLTVEDLDLIAD